MKPRPRLLRSLRTKIATTVALFALVLGLAASTGVGVALWQKDRSDSSDAAASLAFDVIDFDPAKVERMTISDRQIAMVVDDEGDYKHADTGVSQDVFDAAFDSSVLDGIDGTGIDPTEDTATDDTAVDETATDEPATDEPATDEPAIEDTATGDTSADELASDGGFVSFDTVKVGSTNWSFAGLECPDQTVCAAIVTGVSSPSVEQYLLDRWYFLTGAALASAMCAYFSARWLVGRSLRPVEAMRKELESITATRLDQRVVVPQTRDEVQHVGATLNDTLDRLERAVQSNERFVADAAHELRSPLTGVRLALEMEVAKGGQPLLADALTEVDRATRMVDDLLVLAKRSSNPRRIDVDLDDLLNDELNAFRLRFPQIVIEASSQPARMKGDPDSLRRVIRNLLDNAAFYGRGHLAVATSTDTSASAVSLRVDDDGPGIAPADRDRVFERFTRLDSSRSRRTGGSGLGLAIVKEIVDDHHGRITVGDAPLGGARFTVTFT